MINDEKILVLSAVLFTIVVYTLAKLRSEKKQRKKLAIENKKLIADNALFESEQLKFQLQPHTLNNILANLKVMAGKLNRGMESLSNTLEYILYKGEKNLVSIKDEIEFIEQYLQLNDLFITEIDSVSLNKSNINTAVSYYKSPCIPHLISAYFIENAFKHGDVNHPEFLNISITLTTDRFLMSVINKTKHKVQNKQGGIGLKNMRKRLELLQTGDFEIVNSCNENEYHSSLIIDFTK